MLMTTKPFSLLWYAAGLCLFLIHLSAPSSSAVLLHLNGNWSVPFGDDDGPWDLGQSYNLSLDHDPTAMINLNGNLRYTTTEQQREDKTSTLAPSLSVGVNNDLFRFNLSGSQNIRQTGNDPTYTYQSWSSNFSTNFENTLYPQFRLSYGQSVSSNDARPVTLDSDSDNFSAGVDYQWDFIKLRYNYRNDTNTDEISHSTNKTVGHSTNVQLTKNLFNNRLSLSASHQYSINTTETSTTIDGGQILVDLIAAAAFAGIDNTPADDPLPPLPALNDQDFLTATSAQIPAVGQSLNLALQVDLQTFSRLKLYFDRNLSTTTQGRLHWSFYTSQDNDNWVPIPAIPSVDYIEEVENDHTIARVIFPNPVSGVRYVKIVLDADPGFSTAYITEIVSQEEVTGSSDTVTNDYTAQNIQASVNYRPWGPLQLGYSFNRSISDSDRSALSVQDNHIFSTHLNMNRYVNISLSAGEYRDKIKGQDDTWNRTYAFSYQLSPVDSTTFSLNGTRNDHYIGDQKDHSTDSISANLATVIVPDLTANLTYQWNLNRDFEDNTTTRDNTCTANLMARVSSRLNISYFYSYNEVSSHSASLLYHPSELLSFTASAMVEEETQSYSTSLHWRLTNKIQTDLRYILSFIDQETSHGSRFNLNWDISSYLSIRQSLDWSKSETENRWSGLITVSYNF